MPKIVQQSDPVLRQKAATVPTELFGTPELRQIIKQMRVALDACNDGVALAAPQIGLSWRIFIISPKAFDPERAPLPDDLIFINPKISKLSSKKVELDEGCLSVRHIYGRIKRAEKATVTAYDINGQKITRSGSGLLAQIFQHETDHLDGVLFVDKATNLQEIKPEDHEQA